MFKRIKRIHFVGIGGVGMSGIAEVLHNLGYVVSGSDLRESEITRRLAALGNDRDAPDRGQSRGGPRSGNPGVRGQAHTLRARRQLHGQPRLAGIERLEPGQIQAHDPRRNVLHARRQRQRDIQQRLVRRAFGRGITGAQHQVGRTRRGDVGAQAPVDAETACPVVRLKYRHGRRPTNGDGEGTVAKFRACAADGGDNKCGNDQAGIPC